MDDFDNIEVELSPTYRQSQQTPSIHSTNMDSRLPPNPHTIAPHHDPIAAQVTPYIVTSNLLASELDRRNPQHPGPRGEGLADMTLPLWSHAFRHAPAEIHFNNTMTERSRAISEQIEHFKHALNVTDSTHDAMQHHESMEVSGSVDLHLDKTSIPLSTMKKIEEITRDLKAASEGLKKQNSDKSAEIDNLKSELSIAQIKLDQAESDRDRYIARLDIAQRSSRSLQCDLDHRDQEIARLKRCLVEAEQARELGWESKTLTIPVDREESRLATVSVRDSNYEVRNSRGQFEHSEATAAFRSQPTRQDFHRLPVQQAQSHSVEAPGAQIQYSPEEPQANAREQTFDAFECLRHQRSLLQTANAPGLMNVDMAKFEDSLRNIVRLPRGTIFSNVRRSPAAILQGFSEIPSITSPYSQVLSMLAQCHCDPVGLQLGDLYALDASLDNASSLERASTLLVLLAITHMRIHKLESVHSRHFVPSVFILHALQILYSWSSREVIILFGLKSVLDGLLVHLHESNIVNALRGLVLAHANDRLHVTLADSFQMQRSRSLEGDGFTYIHVTKTSDLVICTPAREVIYAYASQCSAQSVDPEGPTKWEDEAFFRSRLVFYQLPLLGDFKSCWWMNDNSEDQEVVMKSAVERTIQNRKPSLPPKESLRHYLE